MFSTGAEIPSELAVTNARLSASFSISLGVPRLFPFSGFRPPIPTRSSPGRWSAEGDHRVSRQVLAKARRGEPVTVAVIGGSIKAGAMDWEKNYGGVVAQWWRRGGKRKIELVNAGSRATRLDLWEPAGQSGTCSTQEPTSSSSSSASTDINDRASAEDAGKHRQVLKQPTSRPWP